MLNMEKKRTPFVRWGVFAVLVFCLVTKCAIWHMQFFGEKDIPVLIIIWSCLLIASPVLLCKHRPWWMLAVLAAANIWLFANFAYERAWGQMLTMDMVRMAGNLRGFEDSLSTYFHHDMLFWLLAPDLLFVASLFFWRHNETRSWYGFGATLALWLLCIPARQASYYRQVLPSRIGYNNHTGLAAWWFVREPLFNPYVWPADAAYTAFMTQNPQNWARPYVHRYGILSFGPAFCVFDRTYRRWMNTLTSENIELTNEERLKLSRITAPEPDFYPQRSLVFILVESLESWAIDYPLPDGFVMPNLHRFIHSHKVYYSPRMYNQLGYGGSGDGQLMALTGLLPVAQGVTVALYGDQPFPNYCHFFQHSVTLNPSPGTWKQDIVNPNYGIKELEESDSIRDDAGIFHRLNSLDFTRPTFVLAITVSSHVPFSKGDEVNLPLDDDMPDNMRKYLKCLHYMDEHLGSFLARLDTDPALSMTDVVITGDHTIFYQQDWQQMQDYAAAKGIDCLGRGYNTTPFVLYSPCFTETKWEENDILQMDIYPSVLHMIGCTQPAWKGFGLDLLSTASDTVPYDQLRLFGRSDARTLSDKLIRARYFSSHTEPSE